MITGGYGLQFEEKMFKGLKNREREEAEYIQAAEAWLSEYIGLYDEIAATEAEKEVIYARATSVTPKGAGAGGGGEKSRTFEEYLKSIERCEEKIGRLLEEQKRIREAIESLPSHRERNVLTCLFINGYSIQTTAELLGCERHAVSRRKRQALGNIIIPEKSFKKCSMMFHAVP